MVYKLILDFKEMSKEKEAKSPNQVYFSKKFPQNKKKKA